MMTRLQNTTQEFARKYHCEIKTAEQYMREAQELPSKEALYAEKDDNAKAVRTALIAEMTNPASLLIKIQQFTHLPPFN